MDKDKILKHLDSAIDKQVPDIENKMDDILRKSEKVTPPGIAFNKKRKRYKRLTLVGVACLICIMAVTFTPVMASLQGLYDKIFLSDHIDDTGVKMAIHKGLGQTIDQTYYDEEHDITVHFESIMTDDKETKLLLTYQSDSIDLENYYIDLFEGVSSIQLIAENGKTIPLENVGWGSRYYDNKENKVAEALSLASIKEFKGQEIRLEIKDLTIWDEGSGSVEATWPLTFKLDESAMSDRDTVGLNKEFTFKNETYTVKKVEFSGLETRVVVVGSDIKPVIAEDGTEYHKFSKLEGQFMNARNVDKETGYTYDESKSGIVLESAGETAVPIFSKGEMNNNLNQYIMVFAPIKDRENCVLKVGDEISISLSE